MLRLLLHAFTLGAVLFSASSSIAADFCSNFMNATLGVESSAAIVDAGKLAVDTSSPGQDIEVD